MHCKALCMLDHRQPSKLMSPSFSSSSVDLLGCVACETIAELQDLLVRYLVQVILFNQYFMFLNLKIEHYL